jgi:aryl-phospho-beta-D-glucosidase BglC (GH1 family)
LIALAAVVCGLISGRSVFGQSALGQSGFVHSSGKDLVGPRGEKLILRGINLGNWLEPEGYMFLLEKGPASPREIEEFFTELAGPEQADAFWREYRRQYIGERDVKFIRDSGFNSVRIPLHYKFFAAGGEGFELLDRVVAWCRRAGLWVILDMHCAPGGQTGTNIDDSRGYPWLFDDARSQRALIDVWKRIAAHYGDNPAILGYDLLNEPIPTSPRLKQYNAQLEPLYRRISSGIREVDKNHLLILGGAQWDSNFSVFGQPFDKNVMYTFHKYWTAPDQKAIQEYLDFRERYGVPIWLGESGENTDQWIKQFVQVLEKNQVGWCFWPYKKMQRASVGDHPSAPVSFPPPVHWDEVLAFAALEGNTRNAEKRIDARPPQEHVRETLRDLLIQIKFENCRINGGYIDALGLQSTGNS